MKESSRQRKGVIKRRIQENGRKRRSWEESRRKRRGVIKRRI